MKLSSKGLSRLGLYESRGFPLGSYEFKQEDFKDSIILSLDEAILLARCCLYVRGSDNSYYEFLRKIHSNLCNRINLANQNKE